MRAGEKINAAKAPPPGGGGEAEFPARVSVHRSLRARKRLNITTLV